MKRALFLLKELKIECSGVLEMVVKILLKLLLSGRISEFMGLE